METTYETKKVGIAPMLRATTANVQTIYNDVKIKLFLENTILSPIWT